VKDVRLKQEHAMEMRDWLIPLIRIPQKIATLILLIVLSGCATHFQWNSLEDFKRHNEEHNRRAAAERDR